ncbi:hypothetical protein KVT40_008142 [Elsinoe batatas]|uniref:Sensitive to high expression protein 9, mitochondrial n=1 Tax=Elsinoe batatas TaxID=2601811 RepID=A0A8K0KWB2_9PEZI|nr:hypothetical protein KVT40_008142 [Elsinoe batatas]
MSVSRHGSRNLLKAVDSLVASSSLARPKTSTWTCQSCRSLIPPARQHGRLTDSRPAYQRTFASSALRYDNKDTSSLRTSLPPSSPQPAPSASSIPPIAEAELPLDASTSRPLPATASDNEHEKLPSHSQSLRSEYSKRFQAFMDDVLAKAAVAGQRLNTYTGTDYTGIENIRRQIVELERKVKALHDSVASAKDAYTTAHSAQISSQREVVSLLERKASWTPHDLDRYTSLIRSEHLHEQGVTHAKQKLTEVERALEEARTDLEKKERRQYHEEQVWSDTIRRNSTWVTFGLMGLNILLLVSNIGIVEPWRRRRLVREVKDALDQRTLVPQNTGTVTAEVRTEATLPTAVAEKDLVGGLVQEGSVSEEQLQTEQSAKPAGPLLEAIEEPSVQVPLPMKADIEAKPNEVAIVVEPSSTGADTSSAKNANHWQAYVLYTLNSAWVRTKEVYSAWSAGPLSDETLMLRKIEVTSIALEGAAAGLTVAGALMWLLRGSR